MSFTICTECLHLRNLEPGTPRERCWYNHLCAAVPLLTIRSPYDGEPETRSGHVYAYCRDINRDGNCQKFEPKNPDASSGEKGNS